jgi:hypothetical protein
MTVLDVDGAVEQIPRAALAQAITARVQAAITEYREERSAGALRRDGFEVLRATLVLLIGVAALQLFWRWLDRLLVRRLQTRITTEASSHSSCCEPSESGRPCEESSLSSARRCFC